MHTLSIQRLRPVVKSLISNSHSCKVTRVQCRPMQQQCVLTQSQRDLTYAKNVPTHFQRVLTHSRRVVTNSRRVLTHSQRVSRSRNAFSCAPNAFSCTSNRFPQSPNCSQHLQRVVTYFQQVPPRRHHVPRIGARPICNTLNAVRHVRCAAQRHQFYVPIGEGICLPRFGMAIIDCPLKAG